MTATVLSIDAAKAANIEIITDGKYAQALHEEITALRASRRSGSACAKTRGEVAYSNKKPWRQKGTGRARAGERGSPIWVGGGVVFGPRPRDYSKKVNGKVKRVALRKAFSERVQAGDVLVVENFAVEQPKTKLFVNLLKSLTNEQRTLVIGSQFDQNTLLAGRNLPFAAIKRAKDVTAEDLLRYRKMVVTNEALSTLSERMVLHKQ